MGHNLEKVFFTKWKPLLSPKHGAVTWYRKKVVVIMDTALIRSRHENVELTNDLFRVIKENNDREIIE